MKGRFEIGLDDGGTLVVETLGSSASPLVALPFELGQRTTESIIIQPGGMVQLLANPMMVYRVHRLDVAPDVARGLRVRSFRFGIDDVLPKDDLPTDLESLVETWRPRRGRQQTVFPGILVSLTLENTSSTPKVFRGGLLGERLPDQPPELLVRLTHRARDEEQSFVVPLAELASVLRRLDDSPPAIIPAGRYF